MRAVDLGLILAIINTVIGIFLLVLGVRLRREMRIWRHLNSVLREVCFMAFLIRYWPLQDWFYRRVYGIEKDTRT